MTREELDRNTFNATITNTSTETLTVDTSRADDLLVFVDDGTTGSAAGSYDIVIDVDVAGVTHQYKSTTGSAALLHEETAYGNSTNVDITNSSGSDGNYRITVVSYRNVD